MKYSELHKKLREAGCYIVRQGGKTPIWFVQKKNKKYQTRRTEIKK